METNKIVDFIAANIKTLFAIVAAVLLVIGATAVWKEKKMKRDLAASSLLFQIQKDVEPLVAQKNYAEAVKKFDLLFEQFPKSRAHFEAELVIGDIFMDAGTYEEALAHYEKALSLASDPFSKTLAAYNSGIAFESAGKFQEAVNRYDEALKNPGADFLRPEMLMAQARCLEVLNQKDKAIELYKTIQEKYASRTYYSGAASAFEKQLTKSL